MRIDEAWRPTRCPVASLPRGVSVAELTSLVADTPRPGPPGSSCAGSPSTPAPGTTSSNLDFRSSGSSSDTDDHPVDGDVTMRAHTLVGPRVAGTGTPPSVVALSELATGKACATAVVLVAGRAAWLQPRRLEGGGSAARPNELC